MPTQTVTPLFLFKFAHNETGWGDDLDSNMDTINAAIASLQSGLPAASVSLAIATDVLESAMADGDVLTYNLAAAKWENKPSVSGAPGAAGQGLNFRGAWVIGTAYIPYDLVTFDGSVWINILANTGSEPDTDAGVHWSLFAAEGSTGPAGASGGVTSINSRTGVITLGEADVTGLVADLATLTTDVAARMIDPMMTEGDIIIFDSGAATRLPIGTVGQVLTVAGGKPSYATPSGGGGGGGGSSIGSLMKMRRTAIIAIGNAGVYSTLNAIGEEVSVLPNSSTWNAFEAATLETGPLASYESNGSGPAGWFGGVPSSGTSFWFYGTNLNIFISFCLFTITGAVVCRAGLFQSNNISALGVGGALAQNHASFRFSIADGDTHFMCVTGDGSAETVTDSGITPVTSVSHRFLIVMDDTTPDVKFYIDDVLVATNITHLPTGTVCDYQVGAQNGGSSKLIGISSVVIQADV